MSNIIRKDFSISGHLAFNPEQKYNYVTIEKGPHTQDSNIYSDINQSYFETLQRVEEHSEKNKPNIKPKPKLDKPFVNTRRVRTVHTTTPCSNESDVSDIDYKTAQSEHGDFEKPFRFIKLRNVQNTPSRVKKLTNST